MRRLAKICVTASFVLLGLAAIAPASAKSYVPSDEARVHAMINKTRSEKGLNPLVRHAQLVSMARGQSDRMAIRGNIYHNPELGAEATRRGLDWARVGENVGTGPSVDVIEQAFLDSPHHYENIVRADYDHVGVGVVRTDGGTMYVTQVFADLRSAPAAVPAAAAPAAAKPALARPAAPALSTPVAAPRPPAPAPRAVKPAPAPEPEPSVDPNAVIGGYVEDTDLPDRDQVLAASAGPLERVFDALVFWA